MNPIIVTAIVAGGFAIAVLPVVFFSFLEDPDHGDEDQQEAEGYDELEEPNDPDDYNEI